MGSETGRLLYSIEQVCEMLSVGRSTVYSLASSGSLTITHVGRRALVTAASLADFVESLTEAVTTDERV